MNGMAPSQTLRKFHSIHITDLFGGDCNRTAYRETIAVLADRRNKVSSA